MFFPFRDDIPHERTPVVTFALIAANALAFLWTWRMPPQAQQAFLYHHAFIPARITALAEGKGIVIPVEVQVPHGNRVFVARLRAELPPNPAEVLLSVVSSMFMHGGWGHLLGNLWFLWLFGSAVEDRLGAPRYVLFYLVGGVLAAAMQWIDEPASIVPMIGASGAIAALLGAYAITYPWARIHTVVWIIVFFTVVDLPAILFLGGWFVYQYLSARSDMAGGVAWWAHVGGFVAGLALMPWIDPRPRRRRYLPDERVESPGADSGEVHSPW